MAVPVVAPMALDPTFDFSEGSEDFGIAQTDPMRSWMNFRDVLDSEKVQLADLFAGGIDQSQVVRVPALRACVRKINRSVAMSLAMARQMEEEKRVLESTKSRIEEAFIQIKSVLLDVDKKHEVLIEETRKGAGVKFQRLSNEGSSVRDDLLKIKTEAETSMVQLKAQQDTLLKAAQDKFVQIEADVRAMAPQGSSGGGGGVSSDKPDFRKKCVLEYQVVKEIPVIGGEKKGFREWHFKLRKNLKSVLGQDHPVHAWMDVAEKICMKQNDVNNVFRADLEVEVQHRHKKGRSEAEEVMEAIMINKFQEGSEAYLMMKREDDVIRAWSQAYR